MEIVCTPETYRRFKSSSLRQTKTHPLRCVFCLYIPNIEEDLRVGAANSAEQQGSNAMTRRGVLRDCFTPFAMTSWGGNDKEIA